MGSPALIIEHDHASPPGHVGDRLRQRGFDLDELQVVPAESYRSPAVVASFPDPTEYRAIVVLGAIWSVYDTATIGTWITAELDMLRAADRAGVPVLGICFGGQALAQAHGGVVQPSPQWEIGWVEVDSAEPGLVAPGPWLQFHHDRWKVPPGARQLASNRVCSQAFQMGRNLAVQFHPEVTPAILELWLANGGDDEAREAGLDPAALLAETRRRDGASRERTHRLVDAFLDRVSVAPPTSGRSAPAAGAAVPR